LSLLVKATHILIFEEIQIETLFSPLIFEIILFFPNFLNNSFWVREEELENNWSCLLHLQLDLDLFSFIFRIIISESKLQTEVLLSDGQRRDGDDDDDRSSDFFNLREDHTQKKTSQNKN
jgi:hypothetical protein